MELHYTLHLNLIRSFVHSVRAARAAGKSTDKQEQRHLHDLVFAAKRYQSKWPGNMADLWTPSFLAASQVVVPRSCELKDCGVGYDLDMAAAGIKIALGHAPRDKFVLEEQRKIKELLDRLERRV